LFTIPVLRYMKTYGLTHEQLAMVSVVQREWAAKNPRATFKTPITVEDVLNSRMIAYPFRLLRCRLVTDGGGALILVAAERARDCPQKLAPGLNRGRSICSAREYRHPDGQPCPSFPRKRESRAARVLDRSRWTPAFAGATKVNSSSHAFRVAGPKAFAEASITHNDVDHLIYDAPVRRQGQALRICRSMASKISAL
jgi:acetyl-CoA acetyltransferase